MHETTDGKGVAVDPPEEQRVGIDIEIEENRPAQPQAQRFEAPAQIVADAAPQLFEQHQGKNRRRQRVEEHDAFWRKLKIRVQKAHRLRNEAKGKQRKTDRSQKLPARRQMARGRIRQEQDKQKAKPRAITQQIEIQSASQKERVPAQRKNQTGSAPQSA